MEWEKVVVPVAVAAVLASEEVPWEASMEEGGQRRRTKGKCFHFPFGMAVLVVLWAMVAAVGATPVRGLRTCLNHEDCVGANRLCYRNITMTVGVCVCREGFRAAVDDAVKCLNIADNECLSDLDCRSGLLCTSLVVRTASSSSGSSRSSSSSLSLHRQRPNSNVLVRPADDLLMAKSAGLLTKRCIFPLTTHFADATIVEHPIAVRPNGEFVDHYYTFGRRNRLHAGFHPQYIKFVEDAMLVLFLLCVLVTLMVVHRASCYRQFRNSRRNGPLRYIIPHRDDQPPTYSNCEEQEAAAAAAAMEEEEDGGGGRGEGERGVDGSGGGGGGVGDGAQGSIVPLPSRNQTSSSSSSSSAATAATAARLLRSKRGRGCRGAGRGETPPPTYDEALLISQASNTPVPLYIALPAEGEEEGEGGGGGGLATEEGGRAEPSRCSRHPQHQPSTSDRSSSSLSSSRRSRSEPTVDFQQQQQQLQQQLQQQQQHLQQPQAGGDVAAAAALTVSLPEDNGRGNSGGGGGGSNVMMLISNPAEA